MAVDWVGRADNSMKLFSLPSGHNPSLNGLLEERTFEQRPGRGGCLGKNSPGGRRRQYEGPEAVRWSPGAAINKCRKPYVA